MSIEAVAKAAGVGKPAIYRRFSDKAALVAHVISRQLPLLEPPDLGTAWVHAMSEPTAEKGNAAFLVDVPIVELLRAIGSNPISQSAIRNPAAVGIGCASARARSLVSLRGHGDPSRGRC